MQFQASTAIVSGYQNDPPKSWTLSGVAFYACCPEGYMSDINFCSSTGREFQWLTASEAAIYLRIKPRTLLHWVRTGKVRGFALSGTKRRIWRFLIADLDAALLKETVLASKTLSVPAEREEQ